jgi:hypothetical protein
MIAARGKPHRLGGVAQERKSAAIRLRHVFEQRPVCIRVRAQLS